MKTERKSKKLSDNPSYPLLGGGIDEILGEIRACVTTQGQAQSVVNGTSLFVSICTDYEQLLQVLQLDQSVNFSAVGQGWAGGVSDKAQTVDQLTINTWSVFLVIYANVGSRTITAAQSQFTPGIEIKSQSELLNFCIQNGTGYVSSVNLGGYFGVIYSFNAVSQSEQKSITNAISSSGIYSAVQWGGGISSSLTTLTQSFGSRMTLSVMHAGLKRPPPASQTPTDLINFGMSLGDSDVADVPAILSYGVSPYEPLMKTLGIDQPLIDQLSNTRNLFCNSSNGGFTRARTTESLLNTMRRIDLVHSRYGYQQTGTDLVDWTQIRQQATNDSASFSENVQKYRNGNIMGWNAADFEFLAILKGRPDINFAAQAAPQPWGSLGNAGMNWDDVATYKTNLDNWVNTGTRISSVQIFSGAHVGDGIIGLQLRYDDVDGNMIAPPSHGGAGGNPSILLSLSGDYLKEVYCVGGKNGGGWGCVEALGFTTTNGSSVFGYLPASWFQPQYITNISAFGCPVAFSGQNGDTLTDFNIYFVRFSPPTWRAEVNINRYGALPGNFRPNIV